MAEIKNNLKIDISNKNHLAYWQDHTTTGILNTGGIKVAFKDTTYRAPSRVYQMMKVAANKHKTADEFLAKLDQARYSNSPFFSKTFSSLTQNDVTTELYNTHDLSQFKVR